MQLVHVYKNFSETKSTCLLNQSITDWQAGNHRQDIICDFLGSQEIIKGEWIQSVEMMNSTTSILWLGGVLAASITCLALLIGVTGLLVKMMIEIHKEGF